MSTGAKAVVWTRWYTVNMSNAILHDTLAVFAVGITLVLRYDLRTIYDAMKY